MNINSYISEEEVLSISEKYISSQNLAHSIKVADYSLVLFDALKEELKLSCKYKAILKYSALLHDIGYYIDKKKHHKHTKNIIMIDSNFNKIPDEFRNFMALISSSHRKDIDKDIKYYSKELQQECLKLISILRIADSLDHTHKFDIKLHKASVQNKTLNISLIGTEASNIIDRLEKKSKLIKDVFNIGVSCEIN
ncbi:guanosine-5'-triphosphate,3'-diphosphate pyrophosphatase [Clostridium homopropionicum DSM 5847]|uniref:Guanosine-5'-triphosphate,3'-diphosphate pyrophosphatase n=1 Tax=Clostridium homopropionicum DSM 5847 TaxID=1121318 RepID=A0A0L6ZCE2_9CLOT|nr:HD domain-containing protein [Clostridium homopropionicum]KOA20649.1 guanosine-5'-triphosphate,3'-diphosphate pyrophosphatase [Clostridium homopropionicum DSM 5847]SFF92329.1 exopolyphosphatase / guanosine-5'-triphosphate,3'-diphosphate pyrophosphatase [Clostridium homopropionicum]